MARLINNVNDLKKHIVVSATFDFSKVLSHAKRTERMIIGLIGRDQYDSLVIHAGAGSDDPVDQVKDLLEEAVSYFAMFQAMPTLNILVTNSGAQTSTNTNSTPSDWRDKLDLTRSLIKIYNQALDDAFLVMEENPEAFPEWRDSQFYTVFKDLIVFQTGIFNKFYTIQNSRQTFVALQPLMREVEDQYFFGMLGQCTLDFLKTSSTNPIVQRAQERAQKATVALTVAKAAAESGTFSFTDTAMVVVSDALPWEKKRQLSDDQLTRLSAGRQKAGEEHLKELKKIIVENPAIFNCYEDKIEPGIENKIIKKKSGLWL